MKHSLPLVGAVCLALAVGGGVQAQGLQRVRKVTPLGLDMATGVVTRGGSPSGGAAYATVGSFANVTTSGFFGTPFVGDEWVDWGVKAGGQSGLVCTLEFAYGTTVLDPSLGGPGVNIQVAVYTGTLGTCAAGDVSSEARRLTFIGLPGSTSGGAEGFVVTVSLGGSSFVLPDGPIGWSYVGADGISGPLLVTVGADPTGTADAFDIYAPTPATTGLCLGTFNFPTPGIASFYLRLEEDDGTEPGSQVVRLGSGVNTGVLSLGSAPPKIGQTWDPSITTDAVAGPAIDFLALSTIADPGLVVPGIGEILIGILFPNPIFVAAAPTPGGTPFSVPFPLDCNFIGASLTCQGGQASAAGGLGLTNAIDLVLGF